MSEDGDAGAQNIGQLVLNTALPIWPLPLSTAGNPLADRVADLTSSWQEEFGLTGRQGTRKSHAQLQPAMLAAYGYPRADMKTLTLASDWLAWFFHVDDLFDEDAIGTDMQLARSATRDLRAVIDTLDAPKDCCYSTPRAILDTLLDLLHRTRQVMSEHQYRIFARHVIDYTDALIAEVMNRENSIVLGLDSYRILRRDTGPFFPFIDLIERAETIELPRHFRDSREHKELTEITADISAYINDIFSVGKEYTRRDRHNLVLVLRDAHDGTITEATEMAIEIITERLSEFDDIERALNRQQRDDISLATVTRWIDGLRSFLCHADWYIGHGRYQRSPVPTIVKHRVVHPGGGRS